MVPFRLRQFLAQVLQLTRRPLRRPHRTQSAAAQTLETRALLSAGLVRNISLSYDSFPDDLTEVNGTLFFSAQDDDNGVELWKSDGTSTGTVLVRDIWTGPDSSFPFLLTNVNGTLFFGAKTDVGFELWKSNGTSTGTVLVKDISEGYSDGVWDHLTNVSGTLFFAATNGSDIELWKSDGTSTGTVLVSNININEDSYPKQLTNVGGTLFFSATSAGGGEELWKSNGTSTGTVLVKDIASGDSGSYPRGLINIGGTLYFQALNSTNGTELWKSNGTSTGTVLVKDIASGDSGSYPEALTNVNGTLFFQATTSANGIELWKSNGTSTGTVLVKDIKSDVYSSSPYHLTNVNGTLFFSASDGDSGVELWKSDGTPAGTVLVKDIDSGNSSSEPNYLTNVNGTLYFLAYHPDSGYELWKSDGTSAGTVLVRDINTNGDSHPQHLTNVNGTLFFKADDGTTGYELWRTVDNSAPTNITISATSVAENQLSGTTVGSFSTTDPDAGGTFTYSLVSGTGDTNNSSFTIVGSTLRTSAVFDFESKSSYSIRARTTDQWGLSFDKQFTITVTNVNETPTNIILSSTSIAENQPSGTTVGTFSTTDLDAGNTFTYALVSGTGDTDNGSFTIVGSTLQTSAVFDFESKSSYSIRARTTDQGGLSFDKQFTITVTNVNDTPTNITLSSTSIAENQPSGTTVGTFSTTDQDAGNTFTYSLVSGTGDTDNGSFTIVGSTLKSSAVFDLESKSSYSILVRTTDQGGLSFDKQFTITVTNVNETPINITLSATSIPENQAIGTSVGTFSTTDPDAANTFTYTLVSGTGSTDNASFTIDGNTLKTAASFDFETKSSYAIRARSTDQGGLWVEQTFTITVSNVNETPTNITLSATSIPENQAIGTSVGTFSTTDPDAANTFTYTLVSGTGSTDNASFTIDGGTLKTAAVFDFETKSSYSILVRTTDQGGLWFEKQFTITVLDGNDVPTGVSLSNVVSELLANSNTSSAIRLADVVLTDDGLGTNTFSVSGPDAGVFEVVANQLRLKAGTVLNYATKKTYAVTVNVDDTSLGNTPDVSVNYTLTLQGLDGTTVQNGSVGRSFVRYVSLDFGTTLALADAVATVGTANPRIRLFFGGLSGTQAVVRQLTAGMVRQEGNRVKLDFGVEGVGGNRKSSLGDGVYRLRVDLDGDGTAEITGTFFRLFGDVDGNGLVNVADIAQVTVGLGTSGPNLAIDVNGDGVIDTFDLTSVKSRTGAKVIL